MKKNSRNGSSVFKSAVLLGLLAAVSAPVFAQDAGTTAPAKTAGPCQADVEKLCAGVEKGQGRIIKCLREHESETSSECRAKMQERKARRDAVKQACAGDRDKFCKDAEKGKVRKCMKRHENELSQACKDAKAKK